MAPLTRSAKAKAAALPASPGRNLLLILPQELRDMIWIALFSSTRLSSGEKWISTKTMKPAPNGLAILRTCKQIYQQTKDLWMKHVLFNFLCGRAFLDKFMPLPLSILSKIRHVRLEFISCPMNVPYSYYDIYYKPAALLMMLPGLCLDKLTIIGKQSYPEVCYDALETLIEKGNGWKELNFITKDSKMLGFAKSRIYIRKPQPFAWNQKLAERDSAESQSSVAVYRSTIPDATGSVLDPSTREMINQTVTSPDALRAFGIDKDKSLTEGEKELLVVVKRGHGADTTITIGPPYVQHNDIRYWADGMSWPEIEQIGFGIEDDWEGYEPVVVDPDHFDIYQNAEEYTWKLW